MQAAQAEEELRKWVQINIRFEPMAGFAAHSKRSVAGKARQEAKLRRDAIAQQELMITVVGIIVLLIFTFVGAAAYLHYMGWIDIKDYFR